MGKRVHNAKARQNPKTIVDNSALKNVKLELDELGVSGSAGYDESNALVLPSKKRATKIKVEHKQNVKILTKKQRKNLQAIVDKKKKKEGRASLLEALAKVQLPENELKQYTSISQVQTVGVKKFDQLDELMAKKQHRQQNVQITVGGKISSIKGRAKRKLLIEEEAELNAKRKNPNIVSLEEDYDDESSDNEVEDYQTVSAERQENVEVKKPETKEIPTASESPMPETEKEISKVSESPIPETLKSLAPPRRTVFVPVMRDPEIQAARLKLPILAEEQQVMEVINENNIIIVAGETGSGKTTQIPQFLYEAGYCENGMLIGITEPRRVAAIAMSKRVGYEMNLSEKEVSYLIRFEGNVTPETKIKFMTDGVLLKEIETDFLLKKYSVIILDEAHERSSYTDILVGLLSRIVPLRLKRGGNPLKLIIMSATLRVEDFTSNARLFKIPPPLIKVEARQFPVTIHFQKRTPDNYVEEAYRKTVKIHSKLPEGGILIFVTGQKEVNQIVRKLRRTFPYKSRKGNEKHKTSEQTDIGKIDEEDKTEKLNSDDEFDMKRAIHNVRKAKKKFLSQLALPKINLDDYKLPGDDTEADLLENYDSDSQNADRENDDLDEDEDEEEDEESQNAMDEAEAASTTKQTLWVLPLYSLLSSEKQNRIFQPPPDGCRLCVVSTNVAETSLTIPNIKYVVDCGKQKTRLYDKVTGVSAFVVTYTSKASADQRAGRAGRISAGHCYRLYSSAVYSNIFEDFPVPDIQKKPVDDLMLQMRCMGIDRVVNFPFPSPPDTVQLQMAEKRLVILGALEKFNKSNAISKETPPMVSRLGHIISRFPVAPRFGKMLALSHQQNLLPYTVCLVAALSVQEVLMEFNFDEAKEDSSLTTNKWQKKRQSWASTGNYQLLGDPMVLLRAIGAAEYAGSKGELVKFCSQNGLRHKAISEVRKLRIQLTNEINLNVSNIDLCVDPGMAPPSDAHARFLRQILLAGMGDKVARKISLSEINDKEEKRRLKYAYNCLDMEDPVFMHSSSVLKQKLSEWIIYQEAYEIQNGDSTKMFIRGITAIEPEWLLIYAPLLCNIKAIKEDPLPRYKAEDGKVYCFVDATFGKAGWELPLTEIEMPSQEKAFCYFAMFLLDGQVCPQLLPFKGKLKCTPSAVTKSWSNLNEHILKFKRCFINKQINTQELLLDAWLKNSNFLLEEYHNMLYDVSLAELTTIWPPTNLN